MSDNNETKITNEPKEVNWIEDAISNKHIKYYEIDHFSNFQEIGTGGFGKVYRASWRNRGYFALKSFFNLDQNTLKAVGREVIY
jgi:hypothetical protein